MIPELLNKISIWIIIIPVLIGLMNFRRLDRDSRWIYLLVLLGTIPQIITAFVPHQSPVLATSYNLFLPVEFAILFIIFKSKFRKRIDQVIVTTSGILFIVIWLYMCTKFGIAQRFFNGLLCLSYMMEMLWILLFFKQEYAAEITIIQARNPFTWYFIALSLAIPGRAASTAFYYYIREPDLSDPIRIQLTIIDSVFNILLYLLFSIGLVIRKSK